MKSIRISDESYNFIRQIAAKERRSFVATLDLFVDLFKEANSGEGDLGREGISPSSKVKVKNK